MMRARRSGDAPDRPADRGYRVPRASSANRRCTKLAGFAATALALGTLLGSSAAQGAVPQLHGFNNHTFVDATTTPDPTSSIDLTQRLEQQAGANVQRVDVSWLAIQPSSGVYDAHAVSVLDQVVGGAAADGMQTLVMLASTPCWASRSLKLGDTCLAPRYWTYPPSDPSTYGRFVAWLTNRYGSRLAGVEVWNEPNKPDGSNFTSLNPAADYAALVESAHAHRTNGVPIVAGALADPDLDFMRQLLAQSAFRSSFDVWSLHTYAAQTTGVVARVQARRDVLTGYGVHAPIWVDEFGWSTCAGCNVSEAAQGTLLAGTFQALTQGSLGVTGAMSYDFRDDGPDPSQTGQNYGLYTTAYQAKGSYPAVQLCLTGGACG